MKDNNQLAYGSIIFSSLLLPINLLFGKLLDYILKSTNPSHVNIYSPLAYLGVTLGASAILYFVWIAVGIGLGVVLWRRGQKDLASLSLVILFSGVVITFAVLIIMRLITNL